MTGFTFQQPWAFAGLLLLPALAGLFYFARRRRLALMAAFGGLSAPAMAAWRREHRWREGCALAGVALLVLAMARPGANPHSHSTQEGGRDVVFILDVSRSMLAGDVHPSRLERAQEDIRRCLGSLRNDRVGLVVFAGMAAIRSPLTVDYDFLRTMLKDASPDSVARGSTYLQSALEKTEDRMLPQERRGFQDVILLTDGEDQGSHPERTVAGLNAAQARLLVVGYGDPHLGARIPDDAGNGFLEFENREVWTRLREDDLRSLADAAVQGKYVRGGTPGFDLGRVYRVWTENEPRQNLHRRGAVEYDEYFAWLLLPALGLLLYPLPAFKRSATAALLAVSLLGGGHLQAASDAPGGDALEPLHSAMAAEKNPARRATLAFQFGVERMQNKSFADAAQAFQEAADQTAEPENVAVCRYNAALAQGRQAEATEDPGDSLAAIDGAIRQLRSALLLRPGWNEPARGLETLYVRRTAAEKALKEQQDQQNRMNKETNALLEELKRLIAEQRALLDAGKRLLRDRSRADANPVGALQILQDKQAGLAGQTESVRSQLNQLQATIRKSIQDMSAAMPEARPAEKMQTPFDEALQHLGLARTAQDQAVALLASPEDLPPAVEAKQSAVDELEAALNSLASKQTGDPSNEESDDMDASDASDQDSADSQSMPAQGDFLSDAVNRSLPRPNFNAGQILQEEQANARMRAKNKPARVGKGEKDW